MKKKIAFGIVLLIIIVIIIVAIVRSRSHTEANRFEFGRVTRGNIVSTVSSTGTLSAKDTVQVGTQVSGTIIKIFANFGYVKWWVVTRNLICESPLHVRNNTVL